MQASQIHLWIEANHGVGIFDFMKKSKSLTSSNAKKNLVYTKKTSGSAIIFLILYVDNILLMGNDIPLLQSTKSSLKKMFSMKDLGEVVYILGIKIYRDRSKRLIRLSQSTYIDKVLNRFSM
jgi:Reverse transcriptase (RNA-dependent DNA polymerase)